jgi:hypothetical protein
MTLEDARREYERGRRHGWVWVTVHAALDRAFLADALLPHTAYWWAGVEDGLREGYAVVEATGSPDRARECFRQYLATREEAQG